MRKTFIGALLIALAAVVSLAAQESFSGRLSDSACGASHQSKAGGLTDRQCLFVCLNARAKYVLVDQHSQVMPIANQDAMGLPLYAGRPVKLTGESKGNAVFVTKIDAIPAHLHLGHVMTNWRDTPGMRGFLPVALDEASVAVLHAGLAAKSTSLEDITLHVGHVLHALDPMLEPKGPGAGYGVRKAATGAQQHLDLARKAEGATADIATYGAEVSASLSSVLHWVDRAIAVAQQTRAATEATDAARAATELAGLTLRISDEGLEQAQARMNLLLKSEGLLGAPR